MKYRASFLRDSVFVLLVVDTLLLFVFLLSGKYVQNRVKGLLQNYNNVRNIIINIVRLVIIVFVTLTLFAKNVIYLLPYIKY